MIAIECPTCSIPVQVDEKYRGVTGKCRHCGGAIVVPQVDPAPQKTRTRPPTTPLTWAVLFVFLGCLALFALNVGYNVATYDPVAAEASIADLNDKIYRDLEIRAYQSGRPIYAITDDHKRALREAMASKRLPSPIAVANDLDTVFIDVRITENEIEFNEWDYRDTGMACALLARNTLYHEDRVKASWNYFVTVKGETPGPDLDFIWGYALFHAETGQLAWEHVQNAAARPTGAGG